VRHPREGGSQQERAWEGGGEKGEVADLGRRLFGHLSDIRLFGGGRWEKKEKMRKEEGIEPYWEP